MTASRDLLPQGKNAKANLDIKVRLNDIYGFNIDKIIKGMLLACGDNETLKVDAWEEQKKIIAQSFLTTIEKNNQLSKEEKQALTIYINSLAAMCAGAYRRNREEQPNGRYRQILSTDVLVQQIKEGYVEDYSLQKTQSIQRKFVASILSKDKNGPNYFLGKLQGYTQNDIGFLTRALRVYSRTVAENSDVEYKVDKERREARFEALMGNEDFLKKNIFPDINALTANPQHKNLLLLKHAIAVIPGIYEDKHPSGFVSLFSDKSQKRIAELKQLADGAMSVNCFDKDDSNTVEIDKLLSQPAGGAVNQVVDLLLKNLSDLEAIKVSKKYDAEILLAFIQDKEESMRVGEADAKKAIVALEKMDKDLLVNTGDHHKTRLLMVVLCEAYRNGMISAEKWKTVPGAVAVFYQRYVNDNAEEKSKKSYAKIRDLYPELKVILDSMVNQNLKLANTLTAAAEEAAAPAATTATAAATTAATTAVVPPSAAPHAAMFRGATTPPAAGGASVSPGATADRKPKK